MLARWKKADWGWSSWNLRGAFGVLDSGRNDVAYEEFKGRKLDRRMLELPRKIEHARTQRARPGA